MEELLSRLRNAFPGMQENPQTPIETAEVPGASIQASRVIINHKIVDILIQNKLVSVWVNGTGSIKETTADEAFDFVQRTFA